MIASRVTLVSVLTAVCLSMPSTAEAGCNNWRTTCSTHSFPTVTRHYSASVKRTYHRSSWRSPQRFQRHFETAPCPSNTSPQPDGTCLIRGHGYSGFIGSTSYGHSSFRTHSYGSYGHVEHVPCPPGTVQQPDRTCLVSGSPIGTPTYHSGHYTSHYWGAPAPYATTAPAYPAPVQSGAPEIVIYTGGSRPPANVQPVPTYTYSQTPIVYR